MKATPCPDCQAKSFDGADEYGVPLRVVPSPQGDLMVIAWHVEIGAITIPVMFGPYDPRDDVDGTERRFARHACVARVAA